MIKLGIKKIEYRSSENDNNWIELKTVHLSATLTEEWSEEAAGKYSTVKVNAQIRNSSKTMDLILEYLSNLYWQYRITDMNGREYILGNSEYRANFNYSRSFGGLNANGYEISIEYESPEGIKASN
ncbi:MAG: hypothetical protein LBP85_09985 [Prevotellaceae bacterium]|jgi:hypothetical protein|nr:hypothetical protein [Prevotellaceae bacterium]